MSNSLVKFVYGPDCSPVAPAGWAFLGAYYVEPALADCPQGCGGYVRSSGADMCRKCLRDWAWAQDEERFAEFEAERARDIRGEGGLYEDALFFDALAGEPTPDERYAVYDFAA